MDDGNIEFVVHLFFFSLCYMPKVHHLSPEYRIHLWIIRFIIIECVYLCGGCVCVCVCVERKWTRLNVNNSILHNSLN